MINARDTNYFIKSFTYCCYVKWLFVNEKKKNINGGFRKEPIKGWLHQHFVKLL